MRRVPLLLVAFAGVSAAQPAPAPTKLEPPKPRVVGEIIDEKNPPAPTIKTLTDIPAELTSAKPWIARRYMTGMIRGSTPHETFLLQRAGTKALVTREVRMPTQWKRGKGLENEVTAWRLESSTQLLGTIEEKGTKVTLSVANGTDKLELSCKKTKVAAARPDAMRGRSPKYSECGDTGRWVPASTKQVAVIKCDPPEDDSWNQLAFAAAPGVEWLHVNDDCVIQGGGWRQVPVDGAIKHPRQRDPEPRPSKKAPGKAAKPD